MSVKTTVNLVDDSKVISEFLDQFPGDMHAGLRKLLVGQARLEDTFEDYQRIHNFALKEGQHPHKAASGGIEPSGHERYTVGNDLVGETLCLRLATLRDHNHELTLKARAFFALVKLKGIPYAPHKVSSHRELLEIAHDYHKYGQGVLAPNETQLREYAESRKGIYDAVKKNGFSYYEKLGIRFDELKTEDEKTKLAMAMEEAWADKKALDVFIKGMEKEEVFRNAVEQKAKAMAAEGKKPEEIATVLDKLKKGPEIDVVVQDEFNGRQYLWTGEKFVNVAAYKENNPDANRKAATEFLSKVSQDDDWQAEVAYPLMVGTTKFVKMWKEWKKPLLQKIKDVFVVLCTDARTLAESILGPSKFRRRNVFRVPGPALADVNGHFNYDAEMFLAIRDRHARMAMEATGEDPTLLSHAQHSNCGAEQLMEVYCDNPEEAGGKVPEAFQLIGEFDKDVYQMAMSHGEKKEVIDYYRKKTGVPITSFESALGLCQLELDRQATMARTGGRERDLTVFHHTSGEPRPRLYVYNPNTKLYVEVPSVQKLKNELNQKAGKVGLRNAVQQLNI